MPNTPRPRKVKKLLKKLAKGKSADKFLKALSEEKFKPGTSEPTKTPQTGVMGTPLKTSEPKAKVGQPLMVSKAEQRKMEKEEKKKKKKLRTPQTRGVMDAPRRGK
jgi:hypothetical protein